MEPEINLDDLYAVLAVVARGRTYFYYDDLSHRYHERTGDWHEPHGSWDEPLGELNRQLHAIGWEPLSAVVCLQATEEPGGKFWGSSRNIPPKPRTKDERTFEWTRILNRVYPLPWPETMPATPPPT